MKYAKPQVLNTKQASGVIMGQKPPFVDDNGTSTTSTSSAYRSDE